MYLSQLLSLCRGHTENGEDSTLRIMILFLFLLVSSLRVVMKKCSSSGGEEAVGATVPCNEPTVRRGSMEEAVDVPLPQANTFPKDLDRRDVAISLNSCTHKQDLIKESHASLEELRLSPEPEPTPFAPFFGDGEHLGHSPVAVPSSKLPTTFSSPGGPSKPKKSKNSQELQKEQEQVRENVFAIWATRAFFFVLPCLRLCSHEEKDVFRFRTFSPCYRIRCLDDIQFCLSSERK